MICFCSGLGFQFTKIEKKMLHKIKLKISECSRKQTHQNWPLFLI